MARQTGYYERATVGGEAVAAFVPFLLPPSKPPIDLGDGLLQQLHRAEQALVQLELAGEMVPSLDWFLYAFVRKEAILSAQIEGTQATLEDRLTYEATQRSSADANEVLGVCNYLDAMRHARDNLRRPDGLPLSLRLLSEAHERLLRGSRGITKLPGQIRRSQNWIGGTRPGNATFVPPPPHRLGSALSDLERYIHAANGLPPYSTDYEASHGTVNALVQLERLRLELGLSPLPPP